MAVMKKGKLPAFAKGMTMAKAMPRPAKGVKPMVAKVKMLKKPEPTPMAKKIR